MMRAKSVRLAGGGSERLAKHRAQIEPSITKGAIIAFAGGVDFNNHRAIWDGLDWVLAKHAAMVLMRGGSSKGAEFVASRWADAHNVTEMIFLRVGLVTGKAAPFKRNDELLPTLPIGVLAFPGCSFAENLADKARGLGVPVWRVVAMRSLSRLLGLLIPVLRQLCDGKCPIKEPRISRRSEEGLSGNLTRRPD